MVQSLSHIRNIKEVYQRPDGALRKLIKDRVLIKIPEE